VICAHQPGSQPIDIPEVIPNPAVVPKQEPTPKEPAPKKPVNAPEKGGQDCGVGIKAGQQNPVLCRILAMMLVGSCRIPPPFFGSFGDGFILDGRPDTMAKRCVTNC
jgi:hypothetical protein